jgi:hypothetical protein
VLATMLLIPANIAFVMWARRARRPKIS